jgi:hypothetical protein
MKISNFGNVNTFEGSADFPFQNPIFAICLNFQQTKSTQKIDIFHTLALKIVK